MQPQGREYSLTSAALLCAVSMVATWRSDVSATHVRNATPSDPILHFLTFYIHTVHIE